MHRLSFSVRSGNFFLILLALAFCMACTASAASKKDLPEVSSDGLHLLKNTKVAIAYAKPGATLAPYSKVMLLDCFVEFKENWARDYNLNEVGLSGRVTDKDADAIKQRLAEEFREVFTEELTKDGYQVVDAAGPDVLLLRPAIINLDVAAPDIMKAGRGNTWVSSAGEMTLYLELYDSSTSDLLGRVIDPRAADDMTAQRANRVTNTAEARKIIRRWADLLSNRLNEVRAANAAK